MKDHLIIEFDGMTTGCVEDIVINSLKALIGFAEGDISQSYEECAKEQEADDRLRKKQYENALKIMVEAPSRT